MQLNNWYDPEYYYQQENPKTKSMQVDDVLFHQPIGFIWFQKPRYRIKAITRKSESRGK